MKFKPKKYPQKLPGSFWGITTFFNPQGYKNKLKNYLEFRAASKKQGLKLLTVELAFGDRPFELREKDTDTLIRLRSDAIMWQREGLVNIGLKKLPKDCDKFAWVDGDILFENNHWVKNTSDLLEKYCVIQLFSSVIINSQNPEKNNLLLNSAVAKITKEGTDIIRDFNIKNTGHTGFAWAGRRSIFNRYGFYDKCVMGGCDRYIILSFYNLLSQKASIFRCQNVLKDVFDWGRKIGRAVNGSVFFTPGRIVHLYHGSLKDRRYTVRDLILNKYNFDPQTDVAKDKNGLTTWNSNKEKLHQAVKEYFWFRNEEGEINLKRLLKKFS